MFVHKITGTTLTGGAQLIEGAGSRTWAGAGPNPGEKEEKVENPEVSRCPRAWGQVSDWRQMAAILTIYNSPSSTLLQARSSQQTMSVYETAGVWEGDTTCPKPGSW